MRIVVRLGGEPVELEVAPDLSEVTLGDRHYPVKVAEGSTGRVEVEVAGERVVLEGWPAGLPDAPAEVALNGERFPLSLERTGGAARPVAPRPTGAGAAAPTGGTPAASGEGVAIVPPMPGKVVELRVAEGDRVTKGQVLLVLEAMKMRNEVPSPVEGVVRGLAVGAGSNVRAREPMLRIVPA